MEKRSCMEACIRCRGCENYPYHGSNASSWNRSTTTEKHLDSIRTQMVHNTHWGEHTTNAWLYGDFSNVYQKNRDWKIRLDYHCDRKNTVSILKLIFSATIYGKDRRGMPDVIRSNTWKDKCFLHQHYYCAHLILATGSYRNWLLAKTLIGWMRA